MKMRSLLFGVILGLLAVVHSSPAPNVTQIPNNHDDDVLEEVMKDGYLVDEMVPHSLTTESPIKKTTIPTSQQPIFHSTIEGSALGETHDKQSIFKEPHTSTSLSGTHTDNPTTSTGDAVSSSSASPTEQSSHPYFIQSSTPSEARSNVTSIHIPISKAEDITDSSGDSLGTEGSTSGSGDGLDFVRKFGGTALTVTEKMTTPSAPRDVVTTVNTEIDGSGTESNSKSGSGSGKSRILNPPMIEKEIQDPYTGKVTDRTETQNKGHSTPGWIIIVAFVVGLAALILICIAIATREKWNGPNQAFEPGTKSSTSNQQREQEMKTILHQESPRENGKAGEYTVIPLDEFPENYSSH